MRLRPRRLASGMLFITALAFGVQAQEIHTHIPGAASGSGVSGSCMYGGDGKLLFAPKGAVCPERQQPPASLAPSGPQSPRPVATSPRGVVAREGVVAPARASFAATRASASREVAPVATGSELPASLRAEAAALFEERERLDVELARAREAVAYEDREAARRVVEAALAKIAKHLEREGRLLREIATGGAH